MFRVETDAARKGGPRDRDRIKEKVLEGVSSVDGKHDNTLDELIFGYVLVLAGLVDEKKKINKIRHTNAYFIFFISFFFSFLFIYIYFMIYYV